MFVCADCEADWAIEYVVGNHMCLSCNGTGQTKNGIQLAYKPPCGGCRGTGVVLNKMAYEGCPECYSRNIHTVEDSING